MATKIQQERLDKLNATTDWHKVNLKRRWGLTSSSERYQINLAKVRHTTRNTGHHTPKKAQNLIDKFRRLYPEYPAVGQSEWVGKLLITLYAFHIKRIAPGPISHMLLYLCWDHTDVWGKFMDKPKKKLEMYNTFVKLGIPQLLIREANKLLKSNKAKYIKNEYNRGWLKKEEVDLLQYDKDPIEYLDVLPQAKEQEQKVIVATRLLEEDRIFKESKPLPTRIHTTITNMPVCQTYVNGIWIDNYKAK